MTWLMRASLIIFLMNAALGAAQANFDHAAGKVAYETRKLFVSALINSNFSELQKILNEHSALINAFDAQFGWPLQWAVYADNFPLVKFLFEYDTEPNFKDWPVLKSVVSFNMAILLLINGANSSQHIIEYTKLRCKKLHDIKERFKDCPRIKPFFEKQYYKRAEYQRTHPKEYMIYQELRQFFKSSESWDIPHKKLLSLHGICQLQEQYPGKNMPYDFIIEKIAEFQKIMQTFMYWPNYGQAYIQYLKNIYFEKLKQLEEKDVLTGIPKELLDIIGQYACTKVLDVPAGALTFEEFVKPNILQQEALEVSADDMHFKEIQDDSCCGCIIF